MPPIHNDPTCCSAHTSERAQTRPLTAQVRNARLEKARKNEVVRVGQASSLQKKRKGAIARKAVQVRNRLEKARKTEVQASSTPPALLMLAQNDTPGKQGFASDPNHQRESKTNLSEADALRWSARKRAKPARYDAVNHQAAGSKNAAPGAKIATVVLKLEDYLGSPRTSTENTRRQLEVPIKQVQRHRPSAGGKDAAQVSSGVWVTLCASRSC